MIRRAKRDLSGDERCRRGGARALGEQLAPREQERHGVGDFVVAHEHHVVDVPLNDLERVLACHWRGKPVGNRTRSLDVQRAARIEALPHPARPCGFHTEDSRMRTQRAHRDSDT